MAEDRTMYLGYGKKSHNEDNKEQRHVVKEDKTSFNLKVPAFTDKGKTFVGWANVKLLKVNETGLGSLKANATVVNLRDLNRQKITDVRNDLARTYQIRALFAKVKAGKATLAESMKVLNSLAKSDPKVAKEAEKLLATLFKA